MAKKSILPLTLHRQFFDEIAIGKKTKEYRERTRYWKKRLEGRDYDLIRFRNGYAKDAPELLVEFRGVRRSGGDYVIKLGRVLNISGGDRSAYGEVNSCVGNNPMAKYR